MQYTNHLIQNYDQYRLPELEGRYLHLIHLKPFSDLFEKLAVKKELIGHSVEQQPIDLYTLGNGPVKVMMWSQMHGNESTTTRGLLDTLNYLWTNSDFSDFIFRHCTLYIIPVLNPDGARAYTRVNATHTDLNRDAQNLSQPESMALRQVFNRISPDYCFNLHDQRTIFSAGAQRKPATVSFLSPAYNETCEINAVREESMRLISGMDTVLQGLIPGQVGRYDDAFNLNCVGDTFQSMGVPTVLFEAGHYELDYERMETRKFIAIAITTALEILANGSIGNIDHENYFNIPENDKLFCDLLIKNVTLAENGAEGEPCDLCFMYRETLEEETIRFIPYFDRTCQTNEIYGHREFSCKEQEILEYDNEEELKTKAMDLLKRMS